MQPRCVSFLWQGLLLRVRPACGPGPAQRGPGEPLHLPLTAIAARVEIRARSQEALLRRPLIYGATVVLHDIEGLPMTEVAAIEQIRPSTRWMLDRITASGS